VLSYNIILARPLRNPISGEADLETTIGDLMSGQYSDQLRVVAFNTAEHWAADVSKDVAHGIRRRADLAGDDLAPSIPEFVETHVARQLSLRLIYVGVGSDVSRSDRVA
jgi:hypothetical protein